MNGPIGTHGVRLPEFYACAAPEVRDEIVRTLRRIAEDARKRIPGLRALILYGSFSTGDFCAFSDASGVIRFISDFDLVAVVPTQRLLVERLRRSKLSWSLPNGAHVDVALESPITLAHLPHILDYRNLFDAGIPIWGLDIQGRRPHSFSGVMSAGQGLRLLCNRLWGLIEAYWTINDKILWAHRTAKTVWACLESDLIDQGGHQSYPHALYEGASPVLVDENRSTARRGISSEDLVFARSALCGRKPVLSGLEDRMKSVVEGLYRRLRHYLSRYWDSQALSWEIMARRLPDLRLGRPFWGNCASFAFRNLVRGRPFGAYLLKALRKPPFLRIWASWMALGRLWFHRRTEDETVHLYNEIMGWFPGHKPVVGVREAVRDNARWQSLVPVSSRI